MSVYIGIIFLVVFALLGRALSIMVPTGKIGPIKPARITPPPPVVMGPYRAPAAVWEDVDEGPNPYQPPVYTYTLLDWARKNNVKTLNPPTPDQYYKPKVQYYKPLYASKGYSPYKLSEKDLYRKTRYYYSPLQYL